MKKINTIYWIVTGLFGAFMLFSAIPDIMITPEAKAFIGHLGYPDYFIQMIGISKTLGVIAILIPGYPRIKEWAYAGLLYDLLAAVYSQIATDGFKPEIFFMVLPIGFAMASYMLYHKKMKEASA
ncbi:MAG: DoxX family protein [Bacteroidetes bacterium]|nr:DoxX family protein [Bacteroidota bacterium]